MPDLNEVLRYTRRMESILENSFGASGRGLSEKVTSVEDLLPDKLVGEIKRIAFLRNRSVHEDGFEIYDMDRFSSRCQRAIDQLDAIAGDLDDEASDDEPAAECISSASEHPVDDKRPNPKEDIYLEEVISPGRGLFGSLMLGTIAVSGAFFLWNIQQKGRIPDLTDEVIPAIMQPFAAVPKTSIEVVEPIPEGGQRSTRWRLPDRLAATKVSEAGRYTVHQARPAGKNGHKAPLPSAIDLVGEYRRNGIRTGVALSIPKSAMPNTLASASSVRFGYAVFLGPQRVPSYCSTSDVSLIAKSVSQDAWELAIKAKGSNAVLNYAGFFASQEFSDSSHVRIVVFPMAYTELSGERVEFNLPATIGNAPNCPL